MRAIYRILILATASALLSCNGEIDIKTVNPPDFSGEKKHDTGTVKAPNIFNKKDGHYNAYRIPAIVRSSKGTLLAFCEGRNGTGDTGDIDLVLRRSTDGGKEWSSLITVWDDGKNTCGNPVPIVDPETGRIHMLMSWNLETDGATTAEFDNGTSTDTRRVFYTYSDDDGLTWAAPKEITNQAKTPQMGWYATGPCHGIIIQNGEHAGRMIAPCDCHENGAGCSHAIYSDDKGATWHISNRIAGNECSVAEMDGGQLIMSIRNSSKTRGISYSSDGGSTWSAPAYCDALPDPGCQGSLLSATIADKTTVVSCNASNATSRINLMLKSSTDGGKSWSNGYTVYPGNSAYSDITILGSGDVGVLYENGSSSYYDRISFVSVSTTFLF